MRGVLLSVVLCLMFHIGHSQVETLNNQSIIEMVGLGFEEEVVIAKIKNCKSEFTTDLTSIKKLMEKGVTSNMIRAMIDATRIAIDAELLASEKAAKSEKKEGVYILLNDNQKIKILPSLFSGSRTNTLASELTGGIAPNKIKSTIHGTESRNIVSDRGCSFMFHFSGLVFGKLRDSDWWFRSATSPNQFSLIKLRQRKDRREIEIGSNSSLTGRRSGVDNRYIVPFTVEKIDELTFKVTPMQPLEPGEYCFYYQGMTPQNDNYKNQSIFDFSVK